MLNDSIPSIEEDTMNVYITSIHTNTKSKIEWVDVNMVNDCLVSVNLNSIKNMTSTGMNIVDNANIASVVTLGRDRMVDNSSDTAGLSESCNDNRGRL